MKISKVQSGVALILLAMLLVACPGVQVKPSAEVSKYEGQFVSVTPVKVVGKAVGVDNPSYSMTVGDSYAGEFVADRTVTISPFAIATTELTYGLWSDVRAWAVENDYIIAPGRSGSEGADVEEKHPVTKVSWQDAIVWCNAYTEMKAAKAKQAIKLAREKNVAIPEDIMQMSQLKPVYYDKEGGDLLRDKNKVSDTIYMDKKAKGFRLPSGVEWEYAARYQGDDDTNAVKLGEAYFTKLDSMSGAKANYLDAAACGEVAWYKANAAGKTHPVGKKKANYLGLYDMSGNVWEWIYDGVASPKAGDDVDPVAPFTGAKRARLGGTWYNEGLPLLVGNRGSSSDITISGSGLGFRVVHSI